MSPLALGWAALLAATLGEEPVAGTSAAVEIVVTAERGPEARDDVPVALTVLTRDDIERLGAADLPEILAHLPGFHVLFAADPGATPMVSSRGFFGGGEAEYVLLLIDGAPVSNVESGVVDWRMLRAADIERVEAMRGAGSALYGDLAIGGVVQVFTRGRPAGDGALGSVSLAAGSFGTAAADLVYRTALGRTGIALRGGHGRTEGYRSHAGEVRSQADVTIDLPHTLRSRWSVLLSGRTFDREEPGPLPRDTADADPSRSDPLFRFDGDETRVGRAQLTAQYDGRRTRSSGRVQLSDRQSDRTQTLLIAAGVGDRTFRSLDTSALDGSFQIGTLPKPEGAHGLEAHGGVNFALGRLATRYRAESESGEPGAELARVAATRDALALYLTTAYRASDRVRLSVGARWDRIADAANGPHTAHEAWSPRAGITLRLGDPAEDGPTLFAQVSRAFKAPTLEQLFDPRPFPDFAGGTFTISNAALAPQTARVLELGAVRPGRRSRLELTFYRMEVEDEIDFDPQTFRYVNLGRTRHVGAELAAHAALGRFAPFVEYAWTRTTSLVGENSGRQLKNIPEHVLRTGVRVELPGGVACTLRTSWIGGRYLDDANRVALDDALVTDLTVARTTKRTRISLDLLNLTNRRYEQLGYELPALEGGAVAYVFPAAGRSVRGGVEWRIGSRS